MKARGFLARGSVASHTCASRPLAPELASLFRGQGWRSHACPVVSASCALVESLSKEKLGCYQWQHGKRVQQERGGEGSRLRTTYVLICLLPRHRLAWGEIWRNFLSPLNPLPHFLRQTRVSSHIEVKWRSSDLVSGDLNSSPHFVRTLLGGCGRRLGLAAGLGKEGVSTEWLLTFPMFLPGQSVSFLVDKTKGLSSSNKWVARGAKSHGSHWVSIAMLSARNRPSKYFPPITSYLSISLPSITAFILF